MTSLAGNVSPELELDLGVLLEYSAGVQAEKCERGAPFIFFLDHQSIARIVQGCCNNWQCPRCGQIRARTEYGRIVEGATILSKEGHNLYFHTLTCRGREMPLAEAETNYGKWTNAALNNMRNQTKSQGGHWSYAQVTERQTRMHPHSHLITTFLPTDAKETTILKRDKNGVYHEREVYLSDWYLKMLQKVGLGVEYEITIIRNAVAVGVYMAKYLFKDAIFTEWPPKWKRVRYARTWPKNEKHAKPDVAFPLLKQSDWYKVHQLHRVVHCDSDITRAAAKRHGLLKIK